MFTVHLVHVGMIALIGAFCLCIVVPSVIVAGVCVVARPFTSWEAV